jgi:glycosyltransferase involved in cell wall biosynthesis
LRTFRFAWRLRHVDWQRFDVLHAHGDDYWLWTRRRPIHVRTMHGSCLAESLHVPGIKERLRMAMLGFSEILATLAADATACVSANTRRSYPWIRRVIVNGVDTAAFTPPGPADAREADPTILFVGTYRNRKRGKLLMDTFESVIRPVLPGARLWMVCGDAPAAPGVEVLGRLSTADLADRYRRAWVFCLPSSYEGFGVPYIEAMASGTPVVATPNVGAREVLDEGRFGLIVDPGQLGQAILSLLQSPGERERLSVAGLARVQQYSWDTIVSRYETLYEELRRAPGAAVAAAGAGGNQGGAA